MKLKPILITIFAFLLPALTIAQQGWECVPEIEKSIRQVKFFEHVFNIRDFGALRGGESDCLPAIRAAIDECSRSGGGRVLVPQGCWFVKGPIVLKSHVELHLSEGSELVFSADEKDYLPIVPTRWEGTQVLNYSPLIYAYQQTDIAITGKGVISGQGAKNIAQWKPLQKEDQKNLRDMGVEGIPLYERRFGQGHHLRPAMIEPVGCSGVLIDGITLTDSPFWVIHPIACESVTVRGVTVNSYNLNNDGCDPESCSNVLIENCKFMTGDDGIAIKSGRDQDGWRMGRPTENVIIRNCTFSSKANGVCIGSEMSGGVRNVYIENITVDWAGNAIYFKSNLDRGGYIENVWVRGVKVDSVKSALIKFDSDYKSESTAHHPTRFRGFNIADVTCRNAAQYGIDIQGFTELPVRDVTISNLTIDNTPIPYRIDNAENILFLNASINARRVDYNTSPVRVVSLNGVWSVALGNEAPAKYHSKVAVPGVITMAKPSLGEDLNGQMTTKIGYDYVWYRHEFDIHAQGYPQAVLKLRAKYNAQVFLNDKEIGFDNHTTYSHGMFDVSDALNRDGKNVLVVRVGSWNTASSPSKENSAEWWRNSRAPGIWDDVTIELGQNISVSHIKILPDLKNEVTECSVTVSNRESKPLKLTLSAIIMDGDREISRVDKQVEAALGQTELSPVTIPSEMLQKWSAGKEGSPKLYTVTVTLTDADGRLLSKKSERFGYRSIEVKGRDVLVNGQKTLFRAENVAFTRAVERWADAVYNPEWIRTFLRTAVQEYNFNYLRIHLGHAYSKWYDIADQEGIMIQDEWRYMHDDEPTGKAKEQATTELTRWVAQNVNHPSIVTWDQENEGNVRLTDLKTDLRRYDPTRLWGEDDFDAHHIYDYSENIVKSPEHKISETKPSTVLESCRLWTNEFGLLEPRENFKTSRTASGWGLYHYTEDDIAQLLADLHADLGTFYRSRRIQAWAPFALLSGAVNGHNFYRGNIADSLTPQPNLVILKELNEPVGTSIEMLQCREWYKYKTIYTPQKHYTKRVWVWNDLPEKTLVTLRTELRELNGTVISLQTHSVEIPAGEALSREITFEMPRTEGIYLLTPSLTLSDGVKIDGVSRRVMVARKATAALEERMAFGGRRTPVEGSHSIIEHFIGCKIPDGVQQSIERAVGEGLIDKIDYKEDSAAMYTVQSTIYLDRVRQIITTTVLDSLGRTISARQVEALPYVSLPAPIKKAIVEIIGTVPVDESRITRQQVGGDTFYEITMIGTDKRYKLNIADNGTLKSHEIVVKKKKR